MDHPPNADKKENEIVFNKMFITHLLYITTIPQNKKKNEHNILHMYVCVNALVKKSLTLRRIRIVHFGGKINEFFFRNFVEMISIRSR